MNDRAPPPPLGPRLQAIRKKRRLSLDDLVVRLDALPGIGPWTAHYIAMRALREPDAFPSGDLGLRKAMAVAGVLPSFKDMDARAEAWRPWRAYAALHLWMSLDGGTGG